MTTSTNAPASHAAAAPALPPTVGLAGDVATDRRLTLTWTRDPAYVEYEIHESTDDPVHTLKDTVPAPPRISAPLKVRSTPLRYGVRGRTASGELGPFGDAVEVLVRSSGGTVTVTKEPFTRPTDPGPTPGGGHTPSAPGDLIPAYWKLTTTLKDEAKPGNKPLEVFRDGRTKLHGKQVDLGNFVDPEHWRLTDEGGRWGIKITCPSEGAHTGQSHNMRWELRQMDAAGKNELDFDLVDGGPTLETELSVHDLQGNAAVVAQIHGAWHGPKNVSDDERKKRGNDDLTVWRAEPNGNSDTYTLWITKQNNPHGGKQVDAHVKYDEVIRVGFRIAKRRVLFLYKGEQLDFEMPIDASMKIDFDNIKFYFKAGLYLQIADHDKTTSGTVTLYSATIS